MTNIIKIFNKLQALLTYFNTRTLDSNCFIGDFRHFRKSQCAAY